MKIQLNDIYVALEAIGTIGDKNMNAVLSYKICRLNNAITAELKTYEDARQKLIDKYCEKDENGQPVLIEQDGVTNYSIAEDMREKCAQEFNDLNSQEIEINANPLKLSELENIDLSPREMMGLMKFIEE